MTLLERKHKQWTDEDLFVLASREAEVGEIIAINQTLSQLTGFSVDAIKGQRRKAVYKSMVVSLRSRTLGAPSPVATPGAGRRSSTTPIPGTPGTPRLGLAPTQLLATPRQLPATPRQLPATPRQLPPAPGTAASQEFLDHFTSLKEKLSDDNLIRITEKILAGEETTVELDSYVVQNLTKPVKKKGGFTPSPKTIAPIQVLTVGRNV